MTPTEITIEAPAPGEMVFSPLVLVTGSLKGEPGGSLTVNGLDAAIDWPRFSAWTTMAEGPGTITVNYSTTDGTTATWSVEIVVDSLPPALTIVAPAPIAVQNQPTPILIQISASDENGLSWITAGGDGTVPLPALPDALTAVQITPGPGLSAIAVEAADIAGHTSREHIAVMAGPFGPCASIPGIPDIVIDMGNDSLASVGQRMAQTLAEVDFAPYLATANPVYEAPGLKVNLLGLTLTGPTVEPRIEGGQLLGLVGAEQVTVTGEVLFPDSGDTFTLLGTINGLSVEIRAASSLEDGLLKVELIDLDMAVESATVATFDEQGAEVSAPASVSGNFLDFVLQAITGAVLEVASAITTQANSYLQASFNLEFLGTKLSISFKLLDFSLLDYSLRLAFDFMTETLDPVNDWPHGCPQSTSGPPTAKSPDAKNTTIRMSRALLDRTFIEFWRSGAMDLVVDQKWLDAQKLELELVCGLLGSYLSYLPEELWAETPMQIRLGSQLPPQLVSRPHPSDDAPPRPALQVAGLMLDHYAIPPGKEAAMIATVMISVTSALQAEVLDNALSLSLADTEFLLDIGGNLPADAKRQVEKGIETYFENLIPDVLASLSGKLMLIPLPSVYGVRLQEGTISLEDPGYLRFDGTLEVD